jgi:Protein of unknown function (DUF4238)
MAGPRQHITPRFHLAQFAGQHPEGCVWVYDADNGTSRACAPDGIGFERNFYSIKKADGTWDTTIDDWITGVEGKAEPIYRQLLQAELPANDTQAKYDFALYLAVLYARTKAQRRMAAQAYAGLIQTTTYATAAHDGAFKSHIARFEREEGKPMSQVLREKVRAAMLDPSDYIISVPKERAILALTIVDGLSMLFFKMHWSTFEPARGFFITSDNPVLHRNDPKTWHPVLGDHGFRNKTAEVTLPLSPQRTLVLTWSPLPPFFAVQRNAVDGLNRSAAINSDRFLYAHVEHRHIAKLSRRFRDVRPRMKISGFGPKNFSEVRLKR